MILNNNPEDFPELPKAKREKKARIDENRHQPLVIDKNINANRRA